MRRNDIERFAPVVRILEFVYLESLEYSFPTSPSSNGTNKYTTQRFFSPILKALGDIFINST